MSIGSFVVQNQLTTRSGLARATASRTAPEVTSGRSATWGSTRCTRLRPTVSVRLSAA
jgi:hypothetical protein